MEKYDLSIMMFCFFFFHFISFKKRFFDCKKCLKKIWYSNCHLIALKQRCYNVGDIYKEVSI